MARNGFWNLVSLRGFRKKRLGMIVGGCCVVAVCLAVRCYWPTASARAQTAGDVADNANTVSSVQAPASQESDTPKGPATSASSWASGKQTVPAIVATVQGQPITREELARECRLHYGKEVLEAMVNKHLILQECRRRDITITRKEVDEEIERMAKRFGAPVEQWLKLLQQERSIKPEQYANDIIWPTLALRKLAGERLAVSQEELQNAFELEFGPAVIARLISCGTKEKALKVRAEAAKNPADFGNLAKTYSEDAASASVKGMIQPIRMHSACPEVEKAAFSMADGEVSDVIATGGQFVIIKREKMLEATKTKLRDVAGRLEAVIRDSKLRTVSGDVFKTLQDHSKVTNVLNDPVLSRQMPGVAAMINDTQITLRQLDAECIERHGPEVLDGAINRKLLELACKAQKITVSDKEIDEEIARAAATMVRPLEDGTPDVKAWLAMVTKKQNVTVELYRRDAVWPSVALRKLAGEKVDVTEEDLKKGFEANYGPRVRCRAIVLDNFRRAQQIWDMVRKTPTLENFGQLATKYSIEGTSRALQGEVPPIRKHGGQPMLEEEAFTLKQGEISGIVQLDDKFVILYCEGITKPVDVDIAQVRDLIRDDVRQKKQRLAMSEFFERLQETSVIDNYLTNTSKGPAKKTAGSRANIGSAVPASYQQPVPR